MSAALHRRLLRLETALRRAVLFGPATPASPPMPVPKPATPTPEPPIFLESSR